MIETQLPHYPPCPKCRSTTACRCGWRGPDSLQDQLVSSFAPYRPTGSWDGDPNAAGHSLEALHGAGPDFQRSALIWRQEVQDEADERARLIRQLQYEESKNRF